MKTIHPIPVKVTRTGRVATTKMIVFEDGIDIRSRSVKVPTVAMLRVNPAMPTYEYIVIGTDYGYIHTTGGDVRTWKSYSGARRAALRYVGL